MTEAVVHHLEVVDVEQDQTHRAILRTTGERVGNPLDEHQPVGKLGERIMTRAVLERGFDAPMLGHLVGGADEAPARAVAVDDRRDVDRDAAQRLRGTPVGLERDRSTFARGAGERADVGDQRVGRHDRAQVARVRVGAEERPVCVVDIREAEDVVARDVDDERGMRKQIEDVSVRRDRTGRRGHEIRRGVVLTARRLPPSHRAPSLRPDRLLHPIRLSAAPGPT